MHLLQLFMRYAENEWLTKYKKGAGGGKRRKGYERVAGSYL